MSAGLRTWCWLFAACLAGLAWRAPDALANPQFWAEDGAVFFVQERASGIAALWRPYAGYLHLLPRLVAWAATAFPLAVAPVVYVFAAWVASATACAYFLHRLLPWRLAAGGAAGLVLMPSSGEVFGTLTNVQWLLQLGLLAACFAPAPAGGRALRVGLAAGVLLASLTGPFSVLLAPIAVVLALPAAVFPAWRDAWRRLLADGGTWRFAALALGAVVQGVFLARHPAATGGGPTVESAWLALTGWTQTHLVAAEPLPGVVFALLATALVVVALWRNGGGAGGALLLCALLALAAAEVVATSGKANVIGPTMGYGDRYFFLLKVAIATCLFAPLARHGRWPTVAVAVVLAVAVLLPPRHLQRPAREDLHWREAIAPVEAGESVVVPIHPKPWTIEVKP